MKRDSLLVCVFVQLTLLLLLSGCEPAELQNGRLVRTAPCFAVSEAIPDLKTKAAPVETSALDPLLDTVVLTADDGQTLRLVMTEEPLPCRSVPATKAKKVYEGKTSLGEDFQFAVWAYNLGERTAVPGAWLTDAGTSVPVKAEKSGALWKPVPDIVYHSAVPPRPGYFTRWFALAPWGAYEGAGSAISNLALTGANMLSPTYTVPVKVADQWDLLAATTAARPIDDSDPVPLVFRHLLTGVRFKRDAGLEIESITVSGIYDRGKVDLTKADRDVSAYYDVDQDALSHDASKDLWSSRAKLSRSYSMDNITWTPDGKNTYDFADKDPNILMMIPQLTPKGAKIRVKIDGTTYTGDISGHRWLPGRMTTYRIDETPGDSMSYVIMTDAGQRSLTLPIRTNARVVIDWGDGTEPQLFRTGTDKPSHTYDASRDNTPTTVTITTYSLGIENYAFTYHSLANSVFPDFKYVLREVNEPLISGELPSFLFNKCSNLTTICKDLFSKNPDATSLYGAFSDCSSLAGIPPGLFDSNKEVTTFGMVFENCKKVTSIPPGLFDENKKTRSFYRAFYGCGITDIPPGLFDKNENVTDFWWTFAFCRELKTIPAGLFDHNEEVLGFEAVFNNTKIESIPPGLFDHNKKVKTFRQAFSGARLTEIPSGLFDHNEDAENFSSVFSSCQKLKSVPVGLFDHNKNAKNFAALFYGCSLLEEVPRGLFDNNTLAENFSNIFGHSGIKTVRADLFEKNKKATNFSAAFFRANRLESVPGGLFAYNKEATDFSDTFNGCVSFVVSDDIFIKPEAGITKENRFTEVSSITFYRCFANYDIYSSIYHVPLTPGGIAPDLWNYGYKAGVTLTSAECFADRPNLTTTDPAGIPSSWK